VAAGSHSAMQHRVALGTAGMLLRSCPADIIVEVDNEGSNGDQQPSMCQATEHVSGEVSSRSGVIKRLSLPVCICAHMHAYVTGWISSLFCQNSTCQHKVKTKYDEVFWKYPLHWSAVSLPAFTV